MAKANKKATTTCLIEGDAQQLIQLVGREIRRMGAQSVITGRTVADRFGLHTTDLECLDLIAMRQETTASELAQATGLTTGAMTAVVDRLEKAGYVARIADPGDRRRHLIRIEPEAIAPIKAVYEPLQFAMFKLCSSFAERDLEIIREFLSRSTDLAVSCVEQIAREVSAKAGKRSSPCMSRQRVIETLVTPTCEESRNIERKEYGMALMPAQLKLTPIEVLERLQLRLEQRMETLQRTRLDEYAIVLSDLETELDLLRRAQRYLE